MIRGYIATSLDGYIAGPGDDLSFLDPYTPESAGYTEFIAEIGTVVMGRITYDRVLRHIDWPYAGKRAIVVTSDAGLRRATDEVEIWTGGVEPLIAALATPQRPGDTWIIGGGRLQQAFLDRDAMDRLEVYVVPALLGGGSPLFPAPLRPRTFRLLEVDRCGELAKLVYGRP